MNITLYSTKCPMCRVIEKKLKMAKLDYNVIVDANKVRELGFLSAPILQVDEDYYTFKEANVFLNSFVNKALRSNKTNAD